MNKWTQIIERACTRCGITKSVNDFYTSKKSKSGYRSECKKCSNKYGSISSKKSREKGVEKPCLVCGKRVGNKINTFCSNSCKSKYQLRDPEKHPGYLGDKLSVVGAHAWARHHFEKSKTCDFCKTEDRPCKDGRSYLDWANKSGEYLRDRNDWYVLCRKCHINYDQQWKRRTRDNKGKFSSPQTENSIYGSL